MSKGGKYMELEFDKAKSLPVLNIGDRKSNIEDCTIYTISHHDKFIYTIDIKYMNGKEEKYLIGHIGRTIQYRIEHKDGMVTDAGTFPIDPSIAREEIMIWLTITPYIEIVTGNIKPAILELKRQDIKFGGKGVFSKEIVDSYPLLEFA